MSTYTQLTQEQRYQIYALKKVGHTQAEVARTVGVHKSTISRKLRRNSGRKGYRPKQAQAQKLACNRQQAKNGARTRITRNTWNLVERLPREDWGPEQISLWLEEQNLPTVSHEWSYQHIIQDKRCGGTLHPHLRCRKEREKRYSAHERRGQLPNRVSIEERLAIVERRERFGDWELDTIIGKSISRLSSRLLNASRVYCDRQSEDKGGQ